MENKTIRVWNYNIKCCQDCPLVWQDEYEDYNCYELNKKVGESMSLVEAIHPDCPFSQALSKENIESCGYKYYSHDGTGKNYRKPWSKNNFFIYNVHIDDSSSFVEISLVGDDGMYFIGHINNLPEFRLILKMLNIE